MTFPSNEDKLKLQFGYGRFKMPYSKSDKENNVKPRQVRCDVCHYVIIVDLAAPYCGMCNSKMITVVNGKLANRNS